MIGVLMKLAIYAIIFGIISFALKKIWADWQQKFKSDDEEIHKRDLKERDRPDVVDLKRDRDGVFRPGDDDKK